MAESGSAFAIAADGTYLFVRDEGAGEPVLFIPGLGYASWCWSKQMQLLSGAARVLAMDNRGAGRSVKPPGPYSIDPMAEDAFAVLTQRGAAPAHVIGASMGGYIAMTLAKHHPEAVRSLVLIATTIGGQGSRPVPVETLRPGRAPRTSVRRGTPERRCPSRSRPAGSTTIQWSSKSSSPTG